MLSKPVKDGISLFAGAMFAAAWWLWIDAHVYVEAVLDKQAEPKTPPILFYYYIPGIVATLGLIMTNIVDLEALSPYSFMFDESIGARVKVWLFASFTVSFGALAGAIWIMSAKYMPPHNKGSQFPGIAIAFQNAIILISSLLLMWVRGERGKEEYSAL